MSVTVKEVEEAGRGLVAIKDIKNGELIVRDAAVIVIPGNLDFWEAGKEIVKQVKKISSKEKDLISKKKF